MNPSLDATARERVSAGQEVNASLDNGQSFVYECMVGQGWWGVISWTMSPAPKQDPSVSWSRHCLLKQHRPVLYTWSLQTHLQPCQTRSLASWVFTCLLMWLNSDIWVSFPTYSNYRQHQLLLTCSLQPASVRTQHIARALGGRQSAACALCHQ